MSTPAPPPPVAPSPAPAQESSSKAVAALVLGIVGIVAVPIICPILAIVFGTQARGEIDRSGGALGGRGLAVAGIVLGWVGLALALLGMILAFVIYVLLASSEGVDLGLVGLPASIAAPGALRPA